MSEVTGIGDDRDRRPEVELAGGLIKIPIPSNCRRGGIALAVPLPHSAERRASAKRIQKPG
jgi:hypothetical protein